MISPARSIAATAAVLTVTQLATAQVTIGADTADLVFDGQATTAFGEALAITPDLDGDGIRDIAVGELAFDPIDGKGFPINNAGAVAVHSGATGALIRRFPGFERDGNLGTAIVVLPDLDGDGTFELAAGAPRLTSGFSPEAGGVVVFSGATGEVLFTLFGELGDRTNLGRSLALVGDLNGDGAEELLAGAPGTGATEPASPGYAVLYDGATFEPVITLDGGQAGSIFGTSVAGGGDMNGDGTPDFVVGAPLFDVETDEPATYLDAGRIVLFSGATLSPIRPVWHDAGEIDTAKANFGSSVAVIDDIDGDGKADVVAGGPESQQGSGGNGFVSVISGGTGDLIHDIEGFFATGEQHGSAVAAAGDVDGDGIADFAASSSQLCFGFCQSRAGEVIVYSGATGDPISVFQGESPADTFGNRFVIEDIDGDGGLDVASAAPFSGPGRVYVFLGEPGDTGCPSDVDGSGVVGFGDLVAVLAAWGPCDGCPADIDGSDRVDFDDVIILLAAWGDCD